MEAAGRLRFPELKYQVEVQNDIEKSNGQGCPQNGEYTPLLFGFPLRSEIVLPKSARLCKSDSLHRVPERVE